MKISVVIPAYNEEKLLKKTLESIRDQIEKPFEIIVVDNNSTDKTAQVAKKMGAIVIKEVKQGQTANLVEWNLIANINSTEDKKLYDM